MKRFGNGKHDLLQFLQSNYGPNGVDKQGSHGMWMRTYVKVKGKWCYLYRAIDADGNLVDSRLSEKRKPPNSFSSRHSRLLVMLPNG
jgi:hypothetical protein